MNIDEYTGKCRCKEGYHLNKITKKCTKCLKYKGKCVEYCPFGS